MTRIYKSRKTSEKSESVLVEMGNIAKFLREKGEITKFIKKRGEI